MESGRYDWVVFAPLSAAGFATMALEVEFNVPTEKRSFLLIAVGGLFRTSRVPLLNR